MGEIYDIAAKMAADGMPVPAILAAIREAEDGKVRNLDLEFSQWWHHYPLKVAKFDAIKAYRTARKVASAEELLDGAMRYANKRDDRPFCNPGTWLRQGRWGDQEVPVAPRQMSGGDLFFMAAMQEGANGQSQVPHDAGGDLFAVPQHQARLPRP